LALSLSPGHEEVQLRIGRCKPLLPPVPRAEITPATTIVAAAQPSPPVVMIVPPRPRVAVLNFVVNASPSVAPPGLGDWAADQMSAYYAPTYDVVDRGQVFWYMGRLGLTTRDLTINASARVCLARALNVRFFAFGIVQQTASFDVTTHLVDAETGCKQATGNIHVQDHAELKLRINELARQTVTDPAERARIQAQGKQSERQINEARQLIKNGQFTQAIQICRAALEQAPDDRAMQALLQNAEQQANRASLEESRKRDSEHIQSVVDAARKQQAELAAQAQAARQSAAQEAAARGVAAKQVQERQRQQAYATLLTQGQRALAQRDYPHAIQALQSAVALNPTDLASRELVQARQAAQDAARTQAAEQASRRQAEQDRERRWELDRSLARVEAERHRQEAERQARKAAQEATDRAAYTQYLAQGQREFAEGRYDAASGAFQSALKLRKTDEAEQLAKLAAEKRTHAMADKRQARAHTDIERRMPQAESTTTGIQPARIPDSPERRFQQSPVTGDPHQSSNQTRSQVPQPAQLPAQVQTKAQAQPEPSWAPQTKSQSQLQLPSRMQASAQTTDRSSLAVAPKPQPQRALPATNVSADFARQMQAGAAYYKQQKFAEAARAYQEALRLKPGDTKAAADMHTAQGRVALAAKRFAEAAREFQESLKLVPNQREALQALKQAQQGRP
jgi:tetratricopeptide (TPR) repeat protein